MLAELWESTSSASGFEASAAGTRSSSGAAALPGGLGCGGSAGLSDSLLAAWIRTYPEKDILRNSCGDVLGHFLQRGRADDPRVTQRGDDLVLQQPADLKQNQSSSSPGLSITAISSSSER
ncbi:hypothetical protein EYF80_012272 [Liparis tanakae]|uniref:Uncharacterized protein n=1 Tax=Liparis tanakae TaxID=230148 RepID=A0A4Z2IHY2_9TELE|nr:hypothetical protein EYF80_012272 [Liparis tanakae]